MLCELAKTPRRQVGELLIDRRRLSSRVSRPSHVSRRNPIACSVSVPQPSPVSLLPVQQGCPLQQHPPYLCSRWHAQYQNQSRRHQGLRWLEFHLLDLWQRGTEMPNYCYCALPPRADGGNLGLSSAGWSRQWEKEWVWFCLQYTARSFGHLRRLRLCVLNLVTLGGRSFASGRGCRQFTVAQSSSWAGDELALGIVCSCLRRLKAKGKKGFSNWSWFLVTSLPPNKRKQA